MLKIKDCMTKKPCFISLETSLVEAAKKMKQYDCGFLPIGDEKNLHGVITDRDIVMKGLAQNKDPNNTSVKSCMTSTQVFSCKEGDDISQAAHLMEQKQIRRLMVKDNTNLFVGVVSLGDIARKSHDDKLCGEIIDKVSQKKAA